MVRLCLLFLIPAVLWATPSVPALAHGDELLTDRPAGSTWPLAAEDIILPTVLVALAYITGIVRRTAVTKPIPWWRHLMFFTGLAAVFLALQSPIDPIAERLFFVHQVQHLLLRMVGPMLIALAWPPGVLIAGTPSVVRQNLLAPLLANNTVRRTFGVIAHPVLATAIFIGALYFWQIPRYHNIAILNEPIHYAMHATMLTAGLIFWWRIFDPRSAPQGLCYSARLMMLWLVILSNIGLGAYTTLKTTVLYESYDVLGRLFGYSSLLDEQIGGIIIWFPSSMVCVAAAFIVIHIWGRHETKMDDQRITWSTSNSSAPSYSTSTSELIDQYQPINQALAFSFAAFVFTVFGTALLIGMLDRLSIEPETGNEATNGRVQHASHGDAPQKLR